MNRNLLLIFLLQIISFSLFSQNKPIDYGNNQAAGKYMELRGIKLYYEVYGSGKPMLLIHGNGGQLKTFSKNIPFFASQYKVIAVDSRSQGKSTDSGDSLSFEMMADDFSALLDSMHIDSAYVIGWSDGGITALLMAMRHPSKVKKLVSTGANLWPDSTAVVPSGWREDYKYYQENKDRVFKTPAEKNHWKMFLLDWFQPNIPLQNLHAIKCPALIVAGDHDVINPEHTVKIFQNIPHAYLWIIPNSGHPTLIEHTEEFDRKVEEFFSTPFVDRE